jgi:murein DD-endopeptidase MepM/ murein hydrolase activator NlpD
VRPARIALLNTAPAMAAVLLALPASPAAATGGASTPTIAGGTQHGQAVRPSRGGRPRVARFSVAPPRLQPGGPGVRFTYRVAGRSPTVDVRIEVVPAGGRGVVRRLPLGRQRTGRRLAYAWVPAAGEIGPGRYVARLHAVDTAGRVLPRTARASGRLALRVLAPAPAPVAPEPAPAPTPAGVFPVQAPWTFAAADGAFGAPRNGHAHQGQDILAAEGTPVVAVRAGAITRRAYQAGGAGHYLVLHGDDGRDFVYMHLRDGSLLVGQGAAVVAGQPLAAVGRTGAATGPHLHFEIWPAGWYTSAASQPVDPLPDLRAWGAEAGRLQAPPSR